MHELGIANGIVRACVERSEGARVRGVRVEIGRLSAVLPDAVRFCFDVCARDTVVEGATLEIIETPGQAVCEDCGGDVVLLTARGGCRCGGTRLRIVGGNELKIKDMEIVGCARRADVPANRRSA